MNIDFHAHILPGVDHGCDDVSMAIMQLKMAMDVGIDHIIATSHYYPHLETLDSFLNRREEGYLKLLEHKDGLPIQIDLGAEVLLFPGLEKHPRLEELCIRNTNCLLIELPFAYWDLELLKTLKALKEKRYFNIVIAHVDRYSLEIIKQIQDLNLNMQINTNAVCTFIKYKRLKDLVASENIVALGSDVHGLSNAYKNYAKALKILGKTAHIIMARTEKILKGDGEIAKKEIYG
ncbi:CpsB/CapC family capsule biosynthesis tyrosine phosphatase [Clostridium sp. Marseille-P299]|uniref:CpsB/CapC family capsule biosynthesis tyrosine phosphatase n=1 Tax=Clostridium sp. Marseille-P299 TaxID=1805477 RepID=UPI00082B4A13|nr:CpsB/CapC family capsule biosynthesis tyrosine phosphatase [Clostridium sp. Marseille-P299]